MAILRAQVNIPRDTALPEDVSQNVWHFRTQGDFILPAQVDPILAALTTFYSAVDDLLSPVLNNPATIKWYDLTGTTQPRVPIRQDNLTLTFGVSATPFPEEVALCLSFQGDPVSGQAQGRRRGRIFLGPLAGGGQVVSGGRVHVGSAQVAQVATAAGALLSASTASADWEWVVYSPTIVRSITIGGSYTPAAHDAAATNVGNGWVDNVYDTQRRRGPRATSRTLFT
jgi:hypothetical protein